MKRLLILCAVLSALALRAAAQKPDTAQILVHYKFSHVRDTNNRAHPYTENMVLFVGKTSGAYRSYDRQLQNELYRRQMQEAITNSADGNIRLDHRVTASGSEYYQFINYKKLVHREVMMNSYIMNDVLPVINWHVGSDKANFAELHCQKATCHFKGRDYTAWFCPDLPVRVGPWKLNGLPGVIVEAYDAKKEIVFKFDRVEKAVLGGSKPIKDKHGRIVTPLDDDADGADPNIIKVPANGIVTTEKELAKLQNAIRKDPGIIAQSMKATAQNNGGPRPDVDVKAGPPPILNNPIELPEK
ncbi:MAG: GLPGLI family protein [Bacteroidetes bacterium]|nr:GLPGLI family protein [Bacteroidota bacterium]